MYKQRHIQNILLQMARTFKIVLVTGARQVGKSTLLANSFPNAKIFTFEPHTDPYLVRQDPALFLEKQQKPLILDEIQYMPELLSTLKVTVDKDPSKGQYFLTGSHSLNAVKAAAESMAGRVGILDLSGMTTYEATDSFAFDQNGQQTPSIWLKEYLRSPETLSDKIAGTTDQSVLDAIWRGGLPVALEIAEQAMVDRYFSSYFDTYIQKDVRVMSDIKNLTDFQNFVRITAALTGQEINYSQIGRDADIDVRSARDWLSLLKHGYQWHELLPYSRNLIKQVVASRSKGFMKDTGLACFLLRIPDASAVLSHPNRGALFETLVVNTITTLVQVLGNCATLFYWRSKHEAEVDLILEHNGALYPIEIKMKATLSAKDLSGLRAFRRHYAEVGGVTIKTGLVIYAGTECYWLDKETIALPWNAVTR